MKSGASYRGERDESVLLAEWYELPQQESAISRDDWNVIVAAKEAVNKVIEDKRGQGEIKSALEAEVTLFAVPEVAAVLNRLGDELRFVLITSKAEVEQIEVAQLSDKGEPSPMAGLNVIVQRSAKDKCERCWHFRDDVGSQPEHATICGRCVENAFGEGEQREFA